MLIKLDKNEAIRVNDIKELSINREAKVITVRTIDNIGHKIVFATEHEMDSEMQRLIMQINGLTNHG